MIDKNGVNWIPIIISIISASIAAISAIIAFINSRSARKSFNLQKSIFEAGKPNFEISDLIDCFLIDEKQSGKIEYVFFIMLTNLSEKPTSISKIRLRIRFNEHDIFLPPNDSLKYNKQINLIKEPINLTPRNSIQCSLNFSLDKKIYIDNVINSYAIVAYDINRNENVKELIYIREELIDYEIKD